MRGWSPDQIARAAGARLVTPSSSAGGPERVVIDSRLADPGTLFVGLTGANDDGGRFAAQALGAGAWGTLTTPEHAATAAAAAAAATAPTAVLAAVDPLKALQDLATAWRRHLNADVIGVTGSTGKTSTKDLLLAVLAPHRRTVASRANLNTEIGLPLEILAAPEETEVLVLEMAMRGAGQIAELAAIAEPGVGVIVSIGPVHLELLKTMEAIAAAKAELIAALPSNGTAIIPAGEPLLAPHLRADLEIVTFATSADPDAPADVTFATSADPDAPADVTLTHAGEHRLSIAHRGEKISLEVPFTQAHMRQNLLAAVAAARAIGVMPAGRIEPAISPGRGQRLELPDRITLIDDCYNANPMSMRAALDDLAATAGRIPGARRVAILGDMLELGPDERRYHEQLGERVSAAEVELLITVGPLAATIADRYDGESYAVADVGEAAALTEELLRPGDVILVKASRGVGLELVCDAIAQGAPA